MTTVRSMKAEWLADQTRIAKAMSHPLRIQIFGIIGDEVTSPNRLAEELKVSVNDVAYHVRALLKLDCIELVDTKQVRGATEHFYRATRRSLLDLRDWEALPSISRNMVTASIVHQQVDDYTASVEAGVLGQRDEGHFHLSRTLISVDREGSARVLEIAEGAREAIEAEQQASLMRMADSGEEVVPMSCSYACFEMPSPKA
jgi:hypothetical protein